MKIGELAKETGVSVRTLHHYDEMSLLTPSMRGENGHRIYDKNDIVRLHQILSLKTLNLSLEEIRDVIGKSNSQIEELLDRNKERLEAEIEEKTTTLKTIRGAQQFLLYKEEVELSELTDIIKDISLSRHYFSESQLSEMEEQEKLVGVERMRAIFGDLARMPADIRAAMQRELPPTDREVLAVARRWFEISEVLIGDDEELVVAGQKMIDENPEVLNHHNFDAEMVAYLREAREHLESTGEIPKLGAGPG